MPPWPSSRFNPSNSTSAGSSQPPSTSGDRQKTHPRIPPDVCVGPPSPNRQNGQQQQQPMLSPTRLSTRPAPSSGGERQHSHSRSMSNPLPKLFSRKRSSPGLRSPLDLPPDDALVPVIESPQSGNSPSRLMSGKKKDDERDMATRQCFCCDSRVRFPRDLNAFRCTTCMTVNDLEALRSRPKEEEGYRARKSQSDGVTVPLSVERTRAIIDRCLITYLETRCTRQVRPSIQTSTADPFVNGDGEQPPIPTVVASELSDYPADFAFVTMSKEMPDFDWVPLSDSFKNISSSANLSRDPVTPSPLPNTNTPSPALSHPPLPGRRPPDPPKHQSSLPSRPAERKSSQTPSYLSNTLPEAGTSYSDYDRVKTIFKPLEDYVLAKYGDYDCLNTSFSTVRPRVSPRARSESAIRTPPPEPANVNWSSPLDSLQHLDAKTLMIGDFAENGQWWTGRAERKTSAKPDKLRQQAAERKRLTTSKSPHVNWDELATFYQMIHTAGNKWWEKIDAMKITDEISVQRHLRGPKNAQEIDNEIAQARQHAERALLKITETILKRPGRPLTEPDNVRFLMIILMNPLLYPGPTKSRARTASSLEKPGLNRTPSQPLQSSLSPSYGDTSSPPRRPGPSPREPSRPSEQHTGIRKRILGLMANSSDNCHRHMIGWFSRLPESRFVKIVDLVASFVTYRLLRRKSAERASTMPQDGGLIPDLSGSARHTSAQLRSATGLGGSVRVKDMETQSVVDYSEDWQLKAAAKVMALLFAANNSWQPKTSGLTPAETNMTSLSRPRAKTHGQLLPTSDYYNTLLDYHDLVADFKAWESKKAKFAFCQYPFFLSMGVKIKVLEYDARRQMELKAREAYFDSVTNNRAIDGYLHLRVRRDCMVDDSLQQISAAVGTAQEELKKGLKVHFTGEEGVDAGGLRKEWFLMIVRDIFDPNHGMFLYDDDSHTCYFNPNSFETSDQYYLVGALLGLAIYNSTILDIAFPPFAFRKLLAAAPPSASNPSLPTAGARAQMTYTVDDLAEYRPALATGLKQLLSFDGDVQETFCRDFVAPIERYGVITEVPLCPNGENKPVTNANRHEFVDLYVRYLLDVAVSRQFEPFKRGFFTVCAGNALSLFRPEEIELLVRGSDEALDVDSLRAVAVYENWKAEAPPHKALASPAETVPLISWFWDFFKKITPEQQRLLLGFVTGSDRIPAAGATNLVLRIVCGGDGVVGRGQALGVGGMRNCDRFPIARTCFNMLVLWGYESKEVLEEKLWRAVCESEGFGLK